MNNWYCELEGEQQGPFDELQMKEFIRSGAVTHDTLVWRGEAGEPQKASETELFLPSGIKPRLKKLSRNLAFMSMVLGILSMIAVCFGPFIGLIAIIMGKNALKEIKKGKYKTGRSYAVTGIVTAAITIIAWFIIALIGIRDYREYSKRERCADNMRAIFQALKNYANDNDKYFPSYNGAQGLDLLRSGAYISDSKHFICPDSKLTPAEAGKPLKEENVSYIYKGGLRDIPDDAKVLILLDKDGNHKNYDNVISCEGRLVESIQKTK